MHSLSLLLGAAAGVNAILGGNIEAVVVPGNQFICAEDCVHQGVFFGTRAACPENETVVSVDKNDQPSIDLNTGSALACRGEPGLSLPGRRQRERKADEAPEQCELRQITDPDRIICASNRELGAGPAGETVQWADVVKLLEEDACAAEQDSQAQPQPPADQKSREQCTKKGQAAFADCDKGFAECDRLGRAAIESCLAGQ